MSFGCQLDLSDKAKNSSRFAPRVLGHAVDQWLPKFGVFCVGKLRFRTDYKNAEKD
ncbi:hypothetical protein LEP1GSC016_4172 [Leptospira borgpetersenii serovar Hardjo-bovis str. Sponselee]|uniref:Uncharacterized protein n=1 Tax=Leptospira borgpetersenii serovar Hardjo-bovis str. Sponselee TaxID=1303729 RepID=M6C8H2_LEPBO|nr:hypothetical protein LEP1GSC016_4172 [Leptospira borgpetersenii serovar Hardjo-bovis str. Sponselee]